MQFSRLPAALLLAFAARAASAQQAGPLALLLPTAARPAAMGNAWVAGRDEYAVFSNPAQLNATNGFGITLSTYGGSGRGFAAASGATMGPITLGWGVHLVDFSAPRTETAYPLAPAALVRGGDADQFSMVALVAGQMTWKRFRIGVAGKYAEDIIGTEASSSSLLVLPSRGAAWLADVGVSHALWTGTAGLSLQNIGQPYVMRARQVSVPTQVSLGWTAQKSWGPLDYGFATQVSLRRGGWVAPALGLETSWSWIEGFRVEARAGARRTETDEEKPVGAGLSFTADRLTLDYGAAFYSDNRMGHRLTVRWR
jgi:hypothetical protein